MTTKKDKMLQRCVILGQALGERDWDHAKKQLAKLVEIIVGESSRSSIDDRREITGRSTYTSRGSHGNTGYAGGCTLAVA